MSLVSRDYGPPRARLDQDVQCPQGCEHFYKISDIATVITYYGNAVDKVSTMYGTFSRGLST